MPTVQTTTQSGTCPNLCPADHQDRQGHSSALHIQQQQDTQDTPLLNGHARPESASSDYSPPIQETQEERQERNSGEDQEPQVQDRAIPSLTSRPQDHRPDSPASLEDSQSESGLDPYTVEAVDPASRLMQRFPSTGPSTTTVDPKQAMVDPSGMTIGTEASSASTAVSPSQIATPPLSPAKILSGKAAHPAQDDQEEGRSSSLPLLPLPAASLVTAEEEKGLDNQPEDPLDDTILEHSGSQAISSQEEQSLSTTEAMVSAPQPTTLASVPKVSAWSTLLPGVAPIPTPRTVARPSAIQKSEEHRLHERFPIVLPHESEAKLSMEMVDLFEDLLPTESSHERRTLLIKKIENILQTEWPGQDIKAHPFGSTVNDLGTGSSDVDICIMTSWTGLKNVQMLANAFRKHGMQKVFCVPRAKVPIVKLWDPELHLSCDMNINTPLGLLNTKMIKTYVAIDPRVRPFAMIIKHWARRRVLNDAANGGTISTYTWICIVINFLQMRSPPILPKLHQIPHTLSEDNQVINGNNTSFCTDLEQLEGFGLPNKETLGGLLYAFFRRFAIEFDYDNHVISVREGCYLTKESKGWHLPGKQYKLFCVEEPFDTSRNLGNSSDMASSKGLKEEFRRALDILYQKVSLDQCCAQFVFPPSYYHSNNNMRKGSNGTMVTNNYGAGRRYGNGFRSLNYYYDDADYDDDEEEDATSDVISVMETLNIGTRPSTSKDPTGSSKNRESNRSANGENGGSGKSNKEGAGQSGAARQGDPSNRSQSRNRTKQSKGDKDGAGESTRSGSSRSKQDKSGGSGSSSSRRNKKSSGGDGQKNGRGSGGGGGGRAPRAAVEFSLADIANVAPKLLSAAKLDQDSSSQAGEGTAGSDATGEEGSGSRNRKKSGRRNVVWSTNSNRGESSRRQPVVKSGPPVEQEKARVIIVTPEEEQSDRHATPSPGS
ncbi:hypothetical protein KVV02_006522 [Mortierella alpina]|uniref:polynucleotide adenylyltransferase n=1 Tax=Mortierella alpina TaxID=64518 RepID=A0A9P8AC68_MORAP|nr:hypothetical protein KVV02_006522 [Mortierella alpina]